LYYLNTHLLKTQTMKNLKALATALIATCAFQYAIANTGSSVKNKSMKITAAMDTVPTTPKPTPTPVPIPNPMPTPPTPTPSPTPVPAPTPMPTPAPTPTPPSPTPSPNPTPPTTPPLL